MKLGALVIIVTLPTKYAIELQLLGGVWILQTLPAIVVGLYTRWLHRWALVAGWAVGMTIGTLMAQSQDFAPTYPLEIFGTTINAYTGVFALTANLVVTLALTLLLRRGGGDGRPTDDADETQPADYDELAEDTVYPPAQARRRRPRSVPAADEDLRRTRAVSRARRRARGAARPHGRAVLGAQGRGRVVDPQGRARAPARSRWPARGASSPRSSATRRPTARCSSSARSARRPASA